MTQPPAPPPAAVSDGPDALVRSASTFLAGMLTGAILVYWLPPAATGGSPAGNGDPTQRMMLMPGDGMQPGMGQPGMGQPGMMGQQPGATGQPGMMGQQPGAMGQQPGAMGQQPGAMGQQPGAMGQQPGAAGQPGMMGQQAGVAGQAGEQKPALPTDAEGRLAGHLRNAPGLWGSVLYQAQNSARAEAKAMAPEIEAHIRAIPQQGATMVTAQPWLEASRQMFPRLQAVGLDTTELSLQIDAVLRPPDQPQ